MNWSLASFSGIWLKTLAISLELNNPMTESGKVLFPPSNTFKLQLALRTCSQTWMQRWILLLFSLCQAIPQGRVLYLGSLPTFKQVLKMNKTFKSNLTFMSFLITSFLLPILISNISYISALLPDCLFYFLLLLHLFSNTFHHPFPFQFFFLLAFFLYLTLFPKTTALRSWFF